MTKSRTFFLEKRKAAGRPAEGRPAGRFFFIKESVFNLLKFFLPRRGEFFFYKHDAALRILWRGASSSRPYTIMVFVRGCRSDRELTVFRGFRG